MTDNVFRLVSYDGTPLGTYRASGPKAPTFTFIGDEMYVPAEEGMLRTLAPDEHPFSTMIWGRK